jgi:hypothetical protein
MAPYVSRNVFVKFNEFETIATEVRVRANASWKASRFLQTSCHLVGVCWTHNLRLPARLTRGLQVSFFLRQPPS